MSYDNELLRPKGKEVLKTLMNATGEMTASDGTSIRWVELGCGAPLVVSPALGTPLISWLPALLALSKDFRIVFALPRGSCEGPTPRDPLALTVRHRAEDLTELINSLGLREYFMVAHSSGVSPVVVGLRQVTCLPSRLCLISSRYAPGRPIDAEALLQRARDDAGFLSVVRTVAVSYSPPSATGVMRAQLQDLKQLEAFLRAFEFSRAFCYTDPWPSAIPVTFVVGEHDPSDVRETTLQVCSRLPRETSTLVDVTGVGHFFVQEDGPEAAKLIARCLASGSKDVEEKDQRIGVRGDFRGDSVESYSHKKDRLV